MAKHLYNVNVCYDHRTHEGPPDVPDIKVLAPSAEQAKQIVQKEYRAQGYPHAHAFGVIKIR